MLKFMKWYFKTLLILTGLAPLFRCGSGYKEKNGKVYFNGNEITDKNFVVLSDEFAKDSTTAYYKDRAFSYADLPTFEVVDDHYAKDKNKVYYCDEYREGQNYYLTKKQTIVELENTHPATFVTLKHGYGKDQSNVYYQGAAFAVKDNATFTTLDMHFAKDAVQAYLDRRPIAKSDGKTFEIMDGNFAKDQHHIYYYAYTAEGKYAITILPCDRETFEIIDYRYSRDKHHVFFLGFTIAGAHAPTFSILPEGYSKDDHAIYFESKKVTDADPKTFVVYRENGEFGHDFAFAHDNAFVYMDDKKLKEADVATFTVLGENYTRDSKHVFYKTSVVKSADPASFKVYPHDFGNADSEDAKHKFHEGILVKDE